MTGLAARTTGAGSRVVLVHGFTQTGRSWDRLAEDLALDHEVVAVDVPGHAGSSDVRVDLDEGAELLGDTCGNASYVGYSMGGRLCLHLAIGRPESVERLVLLGATAGLESPDARAERRAADEQLAAGIERDGVDAFITRWLANPMFAGLPVDPKAVNDRLRNSAEGLAASLRLAGTGAQKSLWSRLGELQMPVLVLAGEHDHKFREIAERMAAHIGSNARHEFVPGAGHPAHLERPEAFLDIVRRFLD